MSLSCRPNLGCSHAQSTTQERKPGSRVGDRRGPRFSEGDFGIAETPQPVEQEDPHRRRAPCGYHPSTGAPLSRIASTVQHNSRLRHPAEPGLSQGQLEAPSMRSGGACGFRCRQLIHVARHSYRQHRWRLVPARAGAVHGELALSAEYVDLNLTSVFRAQARKPARERDSLGGSGDP